MVIGQSLPSLHSTVLRQPKGFMAGNIILEKKNKMALPATTFFHNRSLPLHLPHRQTCSDFRDMIEVGVFVTWSRCLWVTKNLTSMISAKFGHVCRCRNLAYFPVS